MCWVGLQTERRRHKVYWSEVISKITDKMNTEWFDINCQVDKKYDRKWQDYVYIQCEYKSTKQKIKHLLREENKVKENKIS